MGEGLGARLRSLTAMIGESSKKKMCSQTHSSVWRMDQSQAGEKKTS